MRALLDVNVLVALFDEDHALNERAHIWLENNLAHGWASCAITEIGLVRVLSNPNYSSRIQLSVADVSRLLGDFIRNSDHEYWRDLVRLTDERIFDAERVHGPRQLTDVYLLGIAAHHDGRLVTLDQGIPLSAVKTASARNLCLL